MRVEQIMTEDVLTVDGQKTLEVAVETMLRHRVGSVIVTDGGHPRGILTETDAMRAEYLAERPFDEIPVRKVMSEPIITINRGMSVQTAVRKMQEENIKKLPVTEDFDLVGIVTVTDIAHNWTGQMLEASKIDQQRAGWTRPNVPSAGKQNG